jgi:hypothetical protein
VRGVYCTFSTWKKGQKLGKCQLPIKSWPFGADYCRSYYSASWIVTSKNRWASCKADFSQAGFPGRRQGVVPGRLLQAAGQCSVFIYGLAIVPLYSSVSHGGSGQNVVGT